MAEQIQHIRFIKELCPKCNGSMVLNIDPEVGCYTSCINCGYVGYHHSFALEKRLNEPSNVEPQAQLRAFDDTWKLG